MAPTVPACSGRGVAEGFTYRFRNPHSGEIVVFHARGELGADWTPDPTAGNSLEKRLIGVPGDTVVGRNGRVFVNGAKADDIETPEFASVRLGADEYFVLGDNRTYSRRTAGTSAPCPRRHLRAHRSRLLAARAVRCARVRQDSNAARRAALLAALWGASGARGECEQYPPDDGPPRVGSRSA